MKLQHSSALASKLFISGALAVAAGLYAGMSQPAAAQTSAASELTAPSQEEGSSDFFSNRGDNPMRSMLDMIHQANYGAIRSPQEFNQDQQQSINSEAEAFRNQQRNALQRQTQPQNPTPTIVPPQNNNN